MLKAFISTNNDGHLLGASIADIDQVLNSSTIAANDASQDRGFRECCELIGFTLSDVDVVAWPIISYRIQRRTCSPSRRLCIGESSNVNSVVCIAEKRLH